MISGVLCIVVSRQLIVEVEEGDGVVGVEPGELVGCSGEGCGCSD